MNKEEIESRILICEERERDYREVSNTKTADRYLREKEKWEELLYNLNPERDEELREYKFGYNRLENALIEIREYIIKEKEFNDNQIQEYKTCIETNANGKFNEQEKENMEHCMTVNICINYKMNDILQIIENVFDEECER